MPKETDHLETLYREGATEQPPEGIDRAISAAARSALQPWYQRRGPLTGISTAAALLIAAGLVSLQYLPVQEGPVATSPGPAIEFEHAGNLSATAESVSDDIGAPAAEVRRERPGRERAQDDSPPAPVTRKASAVESLPAAAPAEKTLAVSGMRQFAEIRADAEADSPTCELSPYFDGRVYEILPTGERSPRVLSEGRQWQCRDGAWEPVDDRQDTADAVAPLENSPSPEARSEQQ
ncbi:MAG: hypothetical protein R3E82_13235 [Pseudomonadales bacterium]